jgi:tyrosine-protein kinase Etk/Wzc
MQIEQNPESYYYAKSAFRIVKQYWYLFIISIVFFVSIAQFLNWYFQPVYEVGSIILIDEEVAGNKPDPTHEFMKTFSIFTAANDIQLEILKMKSLDLITKALENIHSEISYYTGNGIKTNELHHEAPFQVDFIRNHVQSVGTKFRIMPKAGGRFRILAEKSDESISLCNYEKHTLGSMSSFAMDKEYAYGDTIQSAFYSFRVQCDPLKLAYFSANTKYFFVFNDLNLLAYTYQKSINIDQLAKDVHAASIKLKTKNAQKGIDFIDALTAAYLQRIIDKKNYLAENTIRYLDNQLSVIEDSLKLTENTLQAFRSSKKIMEIAGKSDQEFKGANEIETQKEELQAKTNYYNYVKTSLAENSDLTTLLVPSSMGINDNVLSGIIDEYIKLNNERNNLIANKQTQSPFYKTLTVKIKSQRKTLAENINNLISSNNVLLGSLESRLKKKDRQIVELPSTQREMVGIERKYKLNDNIYNYMLQKKAEAEVAKASNIPENDILEPARLLQPKPVFPNKMMNLTIALLLGLIFPFAGFGVKNFMNNTVNSELEIQGMTQMPFLGRIFHRKGRKPLPLLIDAPKSAISESFRTVRTNLDHFLNGKNHQVVLLTSTLSGEGKSFVALNVATSIALLGKKTVLVSFDIRKPGFYPALKLECQLGTSSILSGRASVSEALEVTSIPNLDFIGAGPVLSNPSELIGSVNTEPMLAELRQKYDYVIIDTPPLGLVTDAFLLMKYADLKIFIIREKVTPKAQLTVMLQEIEHKKIENFYWLVNDVDVSETIYGKKNEYFSQD